MKYKPLRNNQILDAEASLNQAAQLLDIASEAAIESGEVKKILKLYKEWIILAGMITEELEVVDISDVDEPYGFCKDVKEDHGKD